MKIAVTGFRGRLGSWLVRMGCIPIDCDITSPEKISAAIEENNPDVIINCAAYTDVDGADNEQELSKALKINLRGPANLRQNFAGLLIHISTGFIFDGRKGPYTEETKELPEPTNFYGWSKLGGEAAVQIREPTLIVRTLDLFGIGPKPDFVRYVRDQLMLGVKQDYSNILYGNPTYVPHLSQALIEVANRGMTGILHLAGDAEFTRYEWALEIAKAFDLDPDLCRPVERVWGKAKRPLRATLSLEKARSLGIPIFHPCEGLAHLIEREARHDGEFGSSLSPNS